MALYKLGLIIRKRREELGLTQEDLSEGICSVATLSRIENGERLPTGQNLTRLFQRLGRSDIIVDNFIDEEEFELHEKKYYIKHAYLNKDLTKARDLYNEYKQQIASSANPLNEQFLILYGILLYESDFSLQEKLEKCEYALHLTCPRYKSGHIPHILSYEEIILLNDIACFSAMNGNPDTGIDILLKLKRYYESSVIDTEEALRTQPLILYNLSKWLGLQARYDECIEVCNIGIRIAKSTGRCSLLGKTLYNLAWAYVMRGKPEDEEVAKTAIRQAFEFDTILEKKEPVEYCRKFMLKYFHIEL